MLPEGVHHWTAAHPEWEGPVSAYAIDDGERLVLVDPIAVPDHVRELFGAREVVTVLTSTWHERDAASLGFPVWAPAPDRPEEELVPATRYAIGDSVFGLEAFPGREGQLDLVLWHERTRSVIAGDTLVDLGEGLEIRAAWLPDGVTVAQVAAGLRPLLDKPVEVVLPTHGDPADRAALERALGSFVPPDFEVPLGLAAPDFVLEPLGPEHNTRDYAAWTSSLGHIAATPGFPWGTWPRSMTADENRADLERHAEDFRSRKGFTYTVLDPADRDVIGCVYIYPLRDGDEEALVQSWVRQTHAHLDVPLWRAVTAWLEADWPFARVRYAPRA